MGRYFPPRHFTEPRAPKDPSQYTPFVPSGNDYDRTRNPSARSRYAIQQRGATAFEVLSAWAYEVPLNRAARIEALRASVRNANNVALNGLVVVNITVTPRGAITSTILQAQALIGEALLIRNEVRSQLGVILAGTIVQAGFVVQNSAPGTDITVEATGLFTEFDS